ncbi:MAG: DHA2 family efflux MFS transporter permease subunit, partial [Armatimonadota bacterium]
MSSDAAVGPRADASPFTIASKWQITLSVLFGSVMSAIDTSVVNVALPRIQTTYGVGTHEVAWVTTGYLIALVIVMPLTAWVGTVLGRKRMYLLALSIFVGASIACGFSRTLGQLILFRILQGLGGGALMPVAQAIMRETFPVRQQAQAMGFYGMIVMLGPAIGPTLGGWLTDNLSWRWIFFVNVPVGTVAFLMASRFITDPAYMRARGLQRIDGVGIGLLAVGLASLQTLLQEGETAGWFASVFITTLTVVAVLALAMFVVWELRAPAPAVDLRILKNVSFAAGTLIGGVLGLALFGSMILLPLFLQGLLHYSATQSGLTLMPRALTMLLMQPMAGALYNHLGVHVMLPFGLITSGVASYMMAHLTTQSGSLQILVPQVVQGLGFAFMFVSLSTTALATIPRTRMQNATGLYNLVRQLGGSLGTAIVVAVMNHRLAVASAHLVGYASQYNPTFMERWRVLQESFIARGSDAITAGRQALAALDAVVHRQAATVAFNYAFAVIA